jgi:beta-xylosidase
MRLALIERLIGRKTEPGKATIRTLVRFLRLHNARRKFIRAFKTHKLNTLYENIGDMCNEAAPIDWVVLAFQWSATKEGRDYWQSLSNEWIEYIANDKELKGLV